MVLCNTVLAATYTIRVDRTLRLKPFAEELPLKRIQDPYVRDPCIQKCLRDLLDYSPQLTTQSERSHPQIQVTWLWVPNLAGHLGYAWGGSCQGVLRTNNMHHTAPQSLVSVVILSDTTLILLGTHCNTHLSSLSPYLDKDIFQSVTFGVQFLILLENPQF